MPMAPSMTRMRRRKASRSGWIRCEFEYVKVVPPVVAVVAARVDGDAVGGRLES